MDLTKLKVLVLKYIAHVLDPYLPDGDVEVSLSKSSDKFKITVIDNLEIVLNRLHFFQDA